jgi:putative transcriptional regulator
MMSRRPSNQVRFGLAVLAAIPGAAVLLSRPAPIAAGTRVIRTQARGKVRDLAAGKLLVAHEDLPDPNFADTVVLLITYDEEGAMGLVINRSTDIPLSKLFEDMEGAKGRNDRAFAGGPVARTGVVALVRSREQPEQSRHVFADVHLITTQEVLEKSMKAGTNESAFRVYIGYAGWGPGQLDHEVELGTWHILRGEAEVVFDAKPDSVYSRLIEKTRIRTASLASDWPPMRKY